MDYELIRFAGEVVREADILDELDCSCYESAPCSACRIQAAVRSMADVLVKRAATIAAKRGYR